MEPEILRKLRVLLKAGVADEPQVVYLMAAIRKLLEQQGAKQQYQFLTFHCDWVLHYRLSGRTAQSVLKYFDAANSHLKSGLKLEDLPRYQRKEIDDIWQMTHFEHELEAFLKANGLPLIDATRSDGWTHFLHLYASVISDCPLVISSDDTASGIKSVTVNFELANQPVGDEMMFRVTWKILDKNGLSGSLDSYNSFSLSPVRDD